MDHRLMGADMTEPTFNPVVQTPEKVDNTNAILRAVVEQIAADSSTDIAAASDTSSPYGNLTYSLPANTQTGDLLIALYGGKPYNTVPSTPADWSARSGGANGTNDGSGATDVVFAGTGGGGLVRLRLARPSRRLFYYFCIFNMEWF
jgi:hypothetical protein